MSGSESTADTTALPLTHVVLRGTPSGAKYAWKVVRVAGRTYSDSGTNSFH